MKTGAHVLLSKDITILSAATGAINPNSQATYVITDATAAAYTLAAPSKGNVGSVTPGFPSDGKIIIISSSTAAAHVVTITNLEAGASTSAGTATFAAFAGASMTLMAYAGTWLVISSNGVTFA
jgi:hypothetical protein